MILLDFFFYSYSCGGRVVGKGAEHNNLMAKHTFLALVSNSNATASSLLSQDIKLMRSLFQTHNQKKTHSSKSAPTLQLDGGTNWKGKKERRFNYFLHCIYYKYNRKLNPLPNAAQQLFWPSGKFVEDHSKLSCYRGLSVLSSWEKWIRIITDVNHIGFSCYFKDHCSQKSSQICWQVRVQLVLLPLADSLAPGNTRSEQPQSSCLCRQGGLLLPIMLHHSAQSQLRLLHSQKQKQPFGRPFGQKLFSQTAEQFL